MSRRPTLKDVAAYCRVSTALVSVVLNGKEGRISCTPECRQKILDAAKMLGYVPNRLAQSMYSGHPPVAAVMLHMGMGDFFSGTYNYFNDLFPKLTYELNARNIEVLFVPCSSKEEQLERLERIVGGGLAGAVISNIYPDHYTEFVQKLAESGLPGVILGYPYGCDCHCVYAQRDNSYIDKYLAENPRFRTCYFLTRIQDEYVLCRYPFRHDYIWLAEKSQPGPEILQDPNTLIVCCGNSIYKSFSGQIRNPFIVERREADCILPEGIPHYLAADSSVRHEIARAAAELTADWLLKRKEPESKQILFHQ